MKKETKETLISFFIVLALSVSALYILENI